jgi:polyisoprenoid-binding protein YceI
MPTSRSIWLTLALLGAPTAASAEQLALHLDPARTAVHFLLDATMHRVRGRLGGASGTIAFDPAGDTVEGEIVIDLTRADTGNAQRDQKMHDKVLESARFPTATYRVTRIDLPADLHQGRNELQLHGELAFHGARHPLAVPAVVVLDGDRVTATAFLDVPYVAWGLEDPSFFLLRVGKTVRVEIAAAGRLQGRVPTAAAATARRP